MAWSLIHFALVATFAASQGLDALNNVQSNNPSLLEEPSHVIRTNAGDMNFYYPKHGHLFSKFKLALLRMKPNALLLPQYISAKSIFLIQEGNTTLAWVKEGEEVKLNMEMGDAYAILEGTVFYILNQDEQNLVEIIWLMEPEDNDEGFVQPFFVGGGAGTLLSLLSGFDIEVMASDVYRLIGNFILSSWKRAEEHAKHKCLASSKSKHIPFLFSPFPLSQNLNPASL